MWLCRYRNNKMQGSLSLLFREDLDGHWRSFRNVIKEEVMMKTDGNEYFLLCVLWPIHRMWHLLKEEERSANELVLYFSVRSWLSSDVMWNQGSFQLCAVFETKVQFTSTQIKGLYQQRVFSVPSPCSLAGCLQKQSLD